MVKSLTPFDAGKQARELLATLRHEIKCGVTHYDKESGAPLRTPMAVAEVLLGGGEITRAYKT